jgi:16S rRNA C1402 N4-methylase RsmH
LKETIDLLVKKEDGVYLDATFGEGGHTRTVSLKIFRNFKK